MIITGEERKKVLDKIEKLLAHTGDGAVNVNEMAIANEKIKQLLDEYGISFEEIKNIKNKETLVSRIEVNVFHQHPKKWVGSLAYVISDFYECRSIRKRGRFSFIGFDLDCQVVVEVFNRLRANIMHVSRINSTNSIDFSYGVVISLRDRLKEIKKSRTKVSTVTALVVVKKDLVDEQVRKIFPNLIDGSKGKYHLSSDFYKGIEYGNVIEIFNSVEEE